MTTWFVTLLRRLIIWALEDYLVSHPVEKIENLGFGGSVNQKSNAKDNTSDKEKLIIKSHEKRCVTRGGFPSWLVWW